MSITITLNDAVAAQLQARAEAARLSLQELANEILGKAVTLASDAWQLANQRRVHLIQKGFSGGLTEEEAAELQRLQILADQQLEDRDNQRLEDLKRLQDGFRSAS